MKCTALSITILLLLAIVVATGCASEQSPDPSFQPSAPVSQRDLVDLVARFNSGDQEIPRVDREEPWGFAIGDDHDFWVQDKGTGDYRQVSGDLSGGASVYRNSPDEVARPVFPFDPSGGSYR